MQIELKYKRITIWLVSLLVFLGVVLVSLPFGIKEGIHRSFASLGAEQAVIKDVDFNPFLGLLVIKDVQFKTKHGVPLLLDEVRLRISWWSLWSKRIAFDEVGVKGLKINVTQGENGKIQVAGVFLPVGDTSQKEPLDKSSDASVEREWGFGVRRFRIEASEVNYKSAELDITTHIDSMLLTTLLSYDKETSAAASFKGSINGGPLEVSLQASPFSEQQDIEGNIQLESLDLSAFNNILPQSTQELEGKLGINASFDARQSSNGDIKLKIKGATVLADAGLKIPKRKLAVNIEKLGWQGSISFDQRQQDVSWSVDGDIDSIKPVLVQEIKTKKVSMFAAKSANIDGLSVSQNPNIDIKNIQIDSAVLRLSMAKNGKLQLPDVENSPPDIRDNEKEKRLTGKEAPETTISLQRVDLSGDSVLLFEDRSVSPAFKLDFKVNQLVVEEIDSAQPDRPASFSLAGKPDKFSKISLGGKIYPFSEKLTLDVTGHIKSLDLPPLSSYTVPVLGYALTSGHLDADLDFRVNKNNINSENKLIIHKLTVEPSDADKAAKFSKQISMPFDVALSLLRDNNDNIELKLPISGNLENPNFNIADAINQSMGRAMKFAAMSYIKLALQPFGAMVSLYQMADSAGKMVNSVRLDPVKFLPGDSQFDKKVELYLDNAAKLLSSRPKLDLRICGMATVEDLSAILKDQKNNNEKYKAGVIIDEHVTLLITLARDRSVAVKTYLVTKGGVGEGRLFICQPEIDRKEAAASRVELLI